MRTLPFCLAALALVSACRSSFADQPAPECVDPNTPGCVIRSAQERVASPTVTAPDLNELVAGNNAFALDLFQQVRGQRGNVFFSPFSISEALAMTYAGARGDTATQMQTALHLSLPGDRLHPAWNALDQSLAKLSSAQDGKGFELVVANALWGQIHQNFEAPFLDTLGKNYGAGMHIVDFVGAPDAARVTINDWVKGHTLGKVPEILAPKSLDSTTRLVLTNAIYFNAAWQTPFTHEATHPAAFTTDSGATVQVPTMQGIQPSVRYAAGNGATAVEVPYHGGRIAALFLMPDSGPLDVFEASLTPSALDAIVAGLSFTDAQINVPTFSFGSSVNLVDPLTKLGMTDAFTSAADFSGIDGVKDLRITDAVHKAYVGVDEAGTEAAAATAVTIGKLAAQIPSTVLRLDHPFLFLIRDTATGTVLFLGRVADPSAGN